MSKSKDDSNFFGALSPPPRLLMGRPDYVNPALQAMSTQLIGQYDPVMTNYMNETMSL